MSICQENNQHPTYIVTSIKTNHKEIDELKQLHLPIIFYDYDDAYYDEVGGFHTAEAGWNPNGVQCGKCTLSSCANCPSKDVKEEKQ